MRPIVAQDLMTPDVLTVPEDMRLSELASFLADHQVSGVGVRDAADKLVGVVSVTDLAMASTDEDHLGWDRSQPGFYVSGWEDRLAEEELSKLRIVEGTRRVRDIMTPNIYSVQVDAGVSDIARMMLEGHFHRVLVAHGSEIVGIISTSDLLGLLVEGRQSVN